MDLENLQFLAFVEKAHAHQLNFLIIGGLALNLHGIARNTQDVDVWLEPTNESKARLLNTLLDLGYSEGEMADLVEENFTQAQVITLEGPIDLLTQLHHTLDFYICERRARISEVLGIPVKFLHINDLRKAKILARRPQDLRDVIMIDDFLKLVDGKQQ